MSLVHSREMLPVFGELEEFYLSDAFQELLAELFSIPEDLRFDFVEEVILKVEQLERRGIRCPRGISLQRTQFADERPTLFAVVKHVQIGPWKKLTITIDNSGGQHRPVLRDAVEMDSNTVPVASFDANRTQTCDR